MRIVLWGLAALFTISVTLASFCPAAWLGTLVEKQTGGRLTLGDAQGTLWHGSAFLGGAANDKDAIAPLLPGRFGWQLSPMVLLGQVHMQLDNPDSLSAPLSLNGDWTQWAVSRGSLKVPAERLASLGAPLNSMRPSGEMVLSWTALQLSRNGEQLDVNGSTTLDMNHVGSAILPGKPLGAYRVNIDWHGQQGELSLSTVTGPLLISGKGQFRSGHLDFTGKAEAAPGHEERLANLLNIMGQRRTEGNKNIIALEFRQ